MMANHPFTSTYVIKNRPFAIKIVDRAHLQERRGYWRAVVAIAAKNARLAWAVLKFGEDFRLHPAAA